MFSALVYLSLIGAAFAAAAEPPPDVMAELQQFREKEQHYQSQLAAMHQRLCKVFPHDEVCTTAAPLLALPPLNVLRILLHVLCVLFLHSAALLGGQSQESEVLVPDAGHHRR